VTEPSHASSKRRCGSHEQSRKTTLFITHNIASKKKRGRKPAARDLVDDVFFGVLHANRLKQFGYSP
jgi:hypothetical protein